jgi:hypothetical protein
MSAKFLTISFRRLMLILLIGFGVVVFPAADAGADIDDAMLWPIVEPTKKVAWRYPADQDFYRIVVGDTTALSERSQRGLIRLEAGGAVGLLLPAGEWLRLSSDQVLQGLDIQTSISPGLWLTVAAQPLSEYLALLAPAKQHRLLRLHALNSDLLLRLRLGREQAKGFTGLRDYPLKSADPNARDMTARLLKKPHNRLLPYQYISEDEALTVSVKGPQWLRVNSFTEGSSLRRSPQRWHISASLNGKQMESWTHVASVSQRQFFHAGQGDSLRQFWATPKQGYYLKIPQGEHELNLKSSANNWLNVQHGSGQLLFGTNRAFLYPELETRLVEQQSRQQANQWAAQHLNDEQWSQDSEHLMQTLSASQGARASQQSVRKQHALAYLPIYPDQGQPLKIRQLPDFSRRWQSVTPKANRYLEKTDQQPQVRQSHYRDYYQLPAGQTLDFVIAKGRRLPDVRVSFYNPHHATGSLTLTHGDDRQKMRLAPNLFRHWPQQLNRAAEKAHLFSYEQLGVSDLSANDNTGGEPAVVSDAYLALYQQGGKFSVRSALSEPVFLSISYLDSQPAVESMVDPSGLLDDHNKLSWLQQIPKNLPRGLESDLELLQGLIELRHQQFIESIDKAADAIIDLRNNGTGPQSAAESSWLQTAKKLSAKGQSGALAEWLFSNQGGIDSKRWEWRIASLKEQGLWQTYSQMLKALIIYAEDEVLRQFAVTTLRQHLEDTLNDIGLEQLAAFELRGRLDELSAYRFADLLAQSGRFKQAIMLLTLMPQRLASSQLLAWLSLQQNSPTLFAKSLAAMSTEQQDYFVALKKRTDGQSGAVATMMETPLGIKMPLFKVPDGLIVKVAAGVQPLLSTQTLKHSVAYLASAQQGLELSVKGPGILRIKLRQRLELGQVPGDDWVDVRVSGQIYRYPLNGSTTVSRLQAVGSDWQPGLSRRIEIELAGGLHQLKIQPHDLSLFVQASLHAPAISHLQALSKQYQTACIPQYDFWLVDSMAGLHRSCLSKFEPMVNNVAAVAKPLSILPRHYFRVMGNNSGIKKLTEQLWQWEQGGKADTHLSTLLMQGLLQRLDDPQVKPIYHRLMQSLGWELMQPLESAGMRWLELPVLRPESPSARVLSASKGGTEVKGSMFKKGQLLSFSFELDRVTQLKFVIHSQASPFSVTPKAMLKIEKNGELLSSAYLENNQQSSINLSIPAGQHKLDLRLTDASSQQQFTADLFILKNGRWLAAKATSRRKLYMSDAFTSLKFYSPEPALLRIDSYDQEAAVSHRYQAVDAGITLLASNDHRVGRRVFQLQSKSIQMLAEILPDRGPVIVEDVPAFILAPPASVKLVSQQRAVFSDAVNIGLYYNTRRRLNYDESEGSKVEDFNEVGYQRRFYNSRKQRYSRLDVLSRVTGTGSQVVGVKHYFDWLRKDPAQLLYSKASVFYELSESNKSLWSGRVATGWKYRHDAAMHLNNELDISVFGIAWGTVPGLVEQGQQWDTDIYTPYKRDHPNGIDIKDTLRYRPYDDVEWYVQGNVRSNSLADNLRVDSSAVNAGGRFYIQGLLLEAGYQHRYYFSDDDRDTYSDRGRWSAKAAYRFWNRRGDHLLLKANVEFDNELHETLFTIGIHWHDTQTRGVEDFRRSEIPLRDLFKLQSGQQINYDELSVIQ